MSKNKPKTAQPQDTTKVSKVDVCQTPPHALEPLYPYLRRLQLRHPNMLIWESAVGPEKLIEKTLKAQGYAVHGTDLMYGDGYNYFNYSPLDEVGYDGELLVQITNMPFSIKYKWLKRAFELGFPFALLAPYETTFAKDFQNLFNKYNGKPWLIEVLSPERRINFKMPNMGWGKLVFKEEKGWYMSGESAQMPTSWITWGLNVSDTRSDYLRTFYVPMRAVKYDENNNPIVKESNDRRTKKETR